MTTCRQILLLVMFFLSLEALAQKARLDTALLSGRLRWSSVGRGAITGDGLYAKFPIVGEPEKSSTLVVKAIEGNWEQRIIGVDEGAFSANSQWLYYQGRGDSLWEMRLGDSEPRYLGRVRSYRLWGEGVGQRLCYLSTEGILVIRGIAGGMERRFEGVSGYTCSEAGWSLVLRHSHPQDSGVLEELRWVDFPEGAGSTIWRGTSCGTVVFDGPGEQVAFMTPGDSTGTHRIWYYRKGMDGAVEEVDDRSTGIDNGLRVGGEAPVFSGDGRRLFFSLQERPLPKAPSGAAQVDIWNWQDLSLQSMQLLQLELRSYGAVKRIGREGVIRLQGEDELLVWNHKGRDDQAVVYTRKGDGEGWWNPSAQSTFYLESTVDGSRRVIKMGFRNWPAEYLFHFSPDGSQLLWYDSDSAMQGWYRYDAEWGVSRRIGVDIPYPLYDKFTREQYPALHSTILYTPAGWLAGGQRVLLYDEYDIWEVDVTGGSRSVCITGGYGRREGIKLQVAGEGLEQDKEWRVYHPGDTLLLSAFAPGTKENGFYRQVLGRRGEPERLYMGPYVLCAAASQLQHYSRAVAVGMLKARYTNVWVVQRRSAEEAPNYYWTKDFKNYTALSDVHPERQYGWLKTELVRWKLPDGRMVSGILYKPEDLDPRKKYPLLLDYYEQLSDNLHDFPWPGLCVADINVPYFVSRGYLVFQPDIYYRVGHTGESVVEAVVSAAKHLRQLPYVDGGHMGLSGHSHGGFETNYLVTHTHLFAAAVEAAGVTDLVSGYGGLMYGHGGGSGASMHFYYEKQQGRMGASLWEHPEWYLENSPVLRADRVTTPLLMMHNLNDGSVAFSQAVELFTALRRLRKPVWLLQYDKGTHIVFGEQEVLDYTLRLGQFFDHYLKGAPAPVWMTRGVPARRKGLETGLQLDRDHAVR